jgi:hypothetical protein
MNKPQTPALAPGASVYTDQLDEVDEQIVYQLENRSSAFICDE